MQQCMMPSRAFCYVARWRRLEILAFLNWHSLGWRFDRNALFLPVTGRAANLVLAAVNCRDRCLEPTRVSYFLYPPVPIEREQSQPAELRGALAPAPSHKTPTV
jgi:hypothetical protein